MNGSSESRYMLGQIEKKGNNMNLAYNHFMIAARAGHKESMNIVKQLFLRGGDVMKDDRMIMNRV